MTSKRFVYAFMGILLVLISVEFGASTARGQSNGFRVIGPGTVVVGESVYILDTSNVPVGWKKLPQGNFDLPPVPGSSLVSYSSGQIAITDSGEGWGKVNGAWTDLGPVPGSVPTVRESWGQLKAKYAR